MKKNPYQKVILTGVFSLLPFSVSATNIDFEGLADMSFVGSHYGGVTFANAQALIAGSSLNDFDFPPASGSVAVWDNGGAITGVFDSPVTSIGAYLTYGVPVTLSVFDDGGSLITSITTLHSDNTTSSGGTPNELLSLTPGTLIKSFKFSGDPGGFSFVMDDFNYTPSSHSVPETTNSLLLLAGSIGGLHLILRAARRKEQIQLAPVKN